MESDDFKAAKIEYEDDGVQVMIAAGMEGPPPDDIDPQDLADTSSGRTGERDRWGWFVLCNDRVVLAANKTKRTVWDTDGMPAWHNQYNGFLGIASFRARDPGKLPWTTTKRDVDDSDPIYQRAVAKMKSLTRTWITYTQQRKKNLQSARKLEIRAKPKELGELGKRDRMAVPERIQKSQEVNIQYPKPKEQVVRAAKALGLTKTYARQVGIRTFDYFYEREVEE